MYVVLLIEGQPAGEIWVPIGRKRVALEELLEGKGGWPDAKDGGAVPVRRLGGGKVKFRVGNGLCIEGLDAFDVGIG